MSDFVNGVCFDWFEFTTQIDSVYSIIDNLGLSGYEFLETYGSNGYRKGCVFENIFIFWDGKDGMGVHVRMSGQGCRTFEKYTSSSWKKLCEYIVDNASEMHISRVDIAYDDFNELLNLDLLVEEFYEGHFVTRFRRANVENSFVGDNFKSLQQGIRNNAYSLNFGSKSSNTYLRFYDKLKERESKDIISEGCTHWVRAEFMFRNNNAFRFVELFSEGKDIMELFFLVMNNYLRFVVESSDSNKWRWKLADFWDKFCNSVISDRISLYVAPSEEYNVFKLTKYVTEQAGAAVYTYIQSFGINDLMERVEKKRYKLALKYRELLVDQNVESINGE